MGNSDTPANTQPDDQDGRGPSGSVIIESEKEGSQRGTTGCTRLVEKNGKIIRVAVLCQNQKVQSVGKNKKERLVVSCE
jgi:hypothetical protein